MKKIIFLPFLLLFIRIGAQKHTTVFEQSSGKETATYAQTIQWYQELAKTNTGITIKTFGNTDAGYPLHLVLYSKGKVQDPIQWHRAGKVVLLINNGIHPGEPDGIDASMMLLRDLVTGKVNMPNNLAIGIIPIYNIGGSLNRNSFSRVNQDGPISYGFRGNAQNLDLNRDFIKSDSRNAKAFVEIFQFMNPDLFMDNHVSDGADYQHTMTLLTTQHNKLGGPIGDFLHDVFEPALYKSMEAKQWPMCPYVNFFGANPDRGWDAFYDAPRYSSGYAALFQTMGFVPETHMLKPFPQRVKATYALMQTMIEEGSKHATTIKAKRAASIEAVKKQTSFAATWQKDTTRHDFIRFLGYQAGRKTSEVTGMDRLFYDRTQPFDKQVKFFNYFNGVKPVVKPKAYLIPQGWHAVIDLLTLNKVDMKRLEKDTTITVEAYRIEEYKTATRVFEKHYRQGDVKLSNNQQQIRFLKGDYLIPTGQRADRFLVEVLEPTMDDSYFSWNFFDAILQQKEGYSAYRWEDVAAEWLNKNPNLRKQLEEKKLADPKFAANANAQLDFVYKNSPYYEPAHLRYPVYRLVQ
ncbi:MAG: M14 family metallopeptidase [Chitinophagaceae bacterium]|nr:M14 family metallopeptidase [Chitinophagaceae bacterium]